MRDADPSTNEREFLLTALKDGARIDGRKFYDFRTLRLTFGAEYGAVEVQLGNTRLATNPFPPITFRVIGLFQLKEETRHTL